MKRFTKFALASTLGFALAGAITQAQPAPDADAASEPKATPAGPPRERAIGPMIDRLLQKYDVNKDGQLDKTELSTLRKEMDKDQFGAPGRHGGRALNRPRDAEQDGQDRDMPNRPEIGRPGRQHRGDDSAMAPQSRRGAQDGDRPEFSPGREKAQGFDSDRAARLEPRDGENRHGLRHDNEDGERTPSNRHAMAPRGPQNAGGPDLAGPAGRREAVRDIDRADERPTPPAPAKLLRRFDKNQDGLLDEQELAALLQDVRQHRPMLQARVNAHGPSRAAHSQQPPRRPQFDE